MKYYKITVLTLYDNDQRFRSQADGKYIPNAYKFFYRMRNGEKIEKAPVFDYFFLRNYDEDSCPDTHLLDVHSFIGEGSQILGWLVSQDLKLLLENFNLSNPHYFYSSKLKYKRDKFDYYIFQFIGMETTEQMIEEYINLSNSDLFSPKEQKNIPVNTLKEFTKEYNRIITTFRLRNKLRIRKLILKFQLDFFPMNTYFGDILVSEKLRKAIEDAGITGFEFSELDYEVVVEE